MRALSASMLALVLVGCSQLTESGSDEISSGSHEKPAPASAEGSDRIHVADILVAYEGALRAQRNGRTKQEAKKRAEDLRKRVQSGEDFGTLAKEFSDDPVGRYREGDLPNFGRDDHEKSFVDVAFSLKPGELSGIVETPYGFHIILRKD